ncbi:AbrB/MazE/SpoVT family DNA-binding domain-containing protein [Sphingomonas sp. RS2018]
MNAFTKISEKGQVVLPKGTRDRLGWEPGLDLEVIEHADSVTFRRRRPAKTLSPADAVAAFQALYRHEGPPASLDDMKAGARRIASGEDVIRP